MPNLGFHASLCSLAEGALAIFSFTKSSSTHALLSSRALVSRTLRCSHVGCVSLHLSSAHGLSYGPYRILVAVYPSSGAFVISSACIRKPLLHHIHDHLDVEGHFSYST